MAEIFTENIIEPKTWEEVLSQFESPYPEASDATSTGGIYINPILVGASYRSSSGGARVEILTDPVSGITIYDDNGSKVFDSIITGGNVGDIIIGDYTGGQGIWWDKSGASLHIKGSLSASSLDIPDTITSNSFHVDTLGNTWWGSTVIGSATAKILNTGAGTFTNLTVTGGSVAVSTLNGIISQQNLNLANRGWTQTSVFSFTDADTVSWTSGTFTSSDGTIFSISSGNTGNMSSKTYIYLDSTVSSTDYQTTTTSTNAVGAGKVLIAIAQNNTNEATFLVMQGQGGQNIDASSIVSGSITANEIAASTIDAGKMNVAQLSAISANLGTITSGNMTLDSSGYIQGGQTDYNTGSGFFMGYSGGMYKFSIGNPNSYYETWDGTTLTINDSNNTIMYTAGEKINHNESVFFANGSPADFSIVNIVSNGTSDSFGRTTSFPPVKVAQTFSFNPRERMSKIALNLRKFSSPVDNVIVSIQSDSGGSPSGINLATATISGSSLTTSFVSRTFILSNDVELNSGSLYWFIVDRTGALDDTNFYGIQLNSTNPYANGTYKQYTTSWSTVSGTDIAFQIFKSYINGNVYRTTALSSSYNDFLGFNISDVLLGGTSNVRIIGGLSGFTGLTSGIIYYLSDAWGSISSSVGTTTKKVGRSTSTTNIQVLFNP